VEQPCWILSNLSGQERNDVARAVGLRRERLREGRGIVLTRKWRSRSSAAQGCTAVRRVSWGEVGLRKPRPARGFNDGLDLHASIWFFQLLDAVKTFPGTAREAVWSFKVKGWCNAETCAERAVQEGGERRRRRAGKGRGRRGEVEGEREEKKDEVEVSACVERVPDALMVSGR
jgi:hypothetical protein